MSLDIKTLCLGVLTQGEASGYDIKKHFERTFSQFYLAGFGSIYPALGELSREGMVTYRNIPQEGRPDRKVYAITAAGRERFVAALARAKPTHRVRSQFLVLMYFAHLLPPERLEEILAERVSNMQQKLAEIAEYEQQQDNAGHPDPQSRQFCAGFGKAVMQAACRYIEENGPALIEAARKNTPRNRAQRTQG